MAVIFWFAEHPVDAAPAHVEAAAPKVEGATSAQSAARDFWLRDGRLSVLIDAGDIVSVSSAGNYVEYDLTDRRKYLIRSTLQAELSRLAPFGIVRVHRTRLINPRRIVALEWDLRATSGCASTAARSCPAVAASSRRSQVLRPDRTAAARGDQPPRLVFCRFRAGKSPSRAAAISAWSCPARPDAPRPRGRIFPSVQECDRARPYRPFHPQATSSQAPRRHDDARRIPSAPMRA